MEDYSDTLAEGVGSRWEWEARRVRRLAAQRGVALNEERLLLYDIRELMALYLRLETTLRRSDRRLVRALTRLVGRAQRMTTMHRRRRT